MVKFGKILILVLFIGLATTVSTTAQELSRVVQVSGLVVSGDSLYGVPGVAVYVPKSGRGTNTNYVGFFSLPTLKGDSIVINALGFKVRKYIIPDTLKADKLSLIIELMEDTVMLPDVEIFPWPTEQLFKEAFLSLKLPTQDINNLNENLNEQVLKRMLYATSASGGENHRYYMQKQLQSTENRNRLITPALVFTDPFAWSRIISDIKNKKFKSTLKERDLEDDD